MDKIMCSNIIKNQIKLEDKKIPKIAKTIIAVVGFKSQLNGYTFERYNVDEVKFKNYQSEIWLCNKKDDSCTYFINPVKKHLKEHVIGIENNWFGIFENYLILNRSKETFEIFELKK